LPPRTELNDGWQLPCLPAWHDPGGILAYRGGCGGTASRVNGNSSSAWIRLPVGSMSMGVTKMSRFFLVVALDSLRKNRPTSGKSPSIGTLSLSMLTVSDGRPPKTTVWPSHTCTLVAIRSTRNLGRGGVTHFFLPLT